MYLLYKESCYLTEMGELTVDMRETDRKVMQSKHNE